LLVPRLWMLSQSTQNQIFQNQSVIDIVESELKNTNKKGSNPLAEAALAATGLNLSSQIHPLVELGIGSDADFDTYTISSYEDREYVVQYKETDLNFISRLMEHEGIYYYFEHNDVCEKLIITDAIATDEIPNNSEAVFQSEASGVRYDKPVVYKLSRTQKQIPSSVMVKDFNYRSPSLPMEAMGDVTANGIGFVTEFGAHFKTPEDGVDLANVRAQEHQCRQNVFSGESNIADFSCGHLYSLSQHFRSDYNQSYMLIKVRHQGSQEIESWGNIGSTKYSNQFNCIPALLQFRPQRLAVKPRLFGIMNGVIDSELDLGRADLDEDGRYKVQMPFDISGVAAGMASRRIRMAQPYGGAGDDGGGMGMSFPLLKGTEVIWTCIDGDIDRPIITGVVPNPLQPSVTSTKNANSNVIKTSSGITMGFHDGSGRGASQKTTGGGAGAGLGVQQQFQNINSVTNPALSQLQYAYTAKTGAQKTSINTKYHAIEQQHQQTDINDLANWSVDFINFSSYVDDGDSASGKRFNIGVPDYRNSAGTTEDTTNQDSYLRLGKTADWEFQNADLDGFGGQDIDGNEDAKGGKESLDGWFDYTDGNHVSITKGKRTDVVTGGDYSRIITQGGLKTNDPSPVQLDYFREVDNYGWRRTTAAFLSSDTYTYGDSEEFFGGYKFDGMLGMSASAFVGGTLSVSASLDVDIQAAQTYTIGYENAFEVVDGNKYSFAQEDSLEASKKIEIYVEGNATPSVTALKVASAAYLAAIGTMAVVTPILGDAKTYNGMMGAQLAASGVMYAAAIANCQILKSKANTNKSTPLEREAQLVLDYDKVAGKSKVQINASTGAAPGDGSDITLSGDNTKGITMRVGDSSITIKDGQISFVSKKFFFRHDKDSGPTDVILAEGSLTVLNDISSTEGKITADGNMECKKLTYTGLDGPCKV
jgi:type VI secretion system VgrG family protein